jgi:hypothetical protein
MLNNDKRRDPPTQQYAYLLPGGTTMAKILVKIGSLILAPGFCVSTHGDPPAPKHCPATLNFTKRTLAGDEAVNLCNAYPGKMVVVVNTASKYGYSFQYKDLEAFRRHFGHDVPPILKSRPGGSGIYVLWLRRTGTGQGKGNSIVLPPRLRRGIFINMSSTETASRRPASSAGLNRKAGISSTPSENYCKP